MKAILNYIRLFFIEINKTWLLACIILMAALIWCNYALHLEDHVLDTFSFSTIGGFTMLYSLAWFPPLIFFLLLSKKRMTIPGAAWVCLLLAPFLFAVKVGLSTQINFEGSAQWANYWNHILYWPLRLCVLLVLLLVLWTVMGRPDPWWGLDASAFKLKPYALMLAIMIPLLLLAATQPDFQATYPKLRQVLPLPDDATPSGIYKVLFELCYGSDFISIELFFRGFLIIGIGRWLGKDAILPMACFYCSIHFGKPLGECISSFFGGLLLGMVSYHTRSIYGGLMVHLGIAWLMECCGYLAQVYKW